MKILTYITIFVFLTLTNLTACAKGTPDGDRRVQVINPFPWGLEVEGEVYTPDGGVVEFSK